MCPITVVIYVSFEDVIILLSSQWLDFFDHCAYEHTLAMLVIFCLGKFVDFLVLFNNNNGYF